MLLHCFFSSPQGNTPIICTLKRSTLFWSSCRSKCTLKFPPTNLISTKRSCTKCKCSAFESNPGALAMIDGSLSLSFRSGSVADFVKVLLKNIIQQMPAPPQSTSSQAALLMASKNQNAPVQPQSSWFSSVGTGLWTVMTLGLASGSAQPSDSDAASPDPKQLLLPTYLPSFSNDTYNNANSSSPYDTPIDCSSRLLAWQSCHILLVLTNHCTNESLYNPYRLVLFHFTDTQGTRLLAPRALKHRRPLLRDAATCFQDTPTNLPNSEPLPWFSIDYTKLFQMFTFTLHNDQYTLLLYMLLHRNQHFKMFILSRTNIDLLVKFS